MVGISVRSSLWLSVCANEVNGHHCRRTPPALRLRRRRGPIRTCKFLVVELLRSCGLRASIYGGQSLQKDSRGKHLLRAYFLKKDLPTNLRSTSEKSGFVFQSELQVTWQHGLHLFVRDSVKLLGRVVRLLECWSNPPPLRTRSSPQDVGERSGFLGVWISVRGSDCLGHPSEWLQLEMAGVLRYLPCFCCRCRFPIHSGVPEVADDEGSAR